MAGVLHAVVSGYKMGQAGKLVRTLLLTYSGCTWERAQQDAMDLVRVAYREVEMAMAAGECTDPHKAAVAAYALAGGVALGTNGHAYADTYRACCTALTGLLTTLTVNSHMYSFGPLDGYLLDKAQVVLSVHIP